MKRSNDDTGPASSSDHTGSKSIADQLESHFSEATDWRVGLERTQRILLGLDDEPMEFDETSIAHMLKTVAKGHDGLSDEFIVLHAVANALLGADDDFKLKLVQKKRGKYKAPNVKSDVHNRQMSILYSVASLEKKGWKTEAAIARMEKGFGVSRAQVFADIKAAEEFLESCRKIFGPNDNNKSPRSMPFLLLVKLEPIFFISKPYWDMLRLIRFSGRSPMKSSFICS